MINTIAKTARISTKTIRDGSVFGRDAFCEKLENKLYNRLSKYKHTQFEYIGDIIRNILPTKLISVEKISKSDEFCSGSVHLANDTQNIIPADVVGYIVTYKNNYKKEHFGGVAIDVLMHEVHHLFNYFTHPKIPARILKISKLPSDKYNFQEFFVKHFQSPKTPKDCAIATEKLISENDKYKIDLLQYFRYKIIDEIGAYNSGKEFLFKYRQKHPKNKNKEYSDQVKILHLREKLDLISDMLKDAIKAERQK